MALVVGTWIWGTQYGPEYIDRLRAGVARHLKQEYRFVVFRPEPEDEYLTEIQGCFCRLRMFDPKWQAKHGVDDRLVCVDLDSIITGDLDSLFDRPELFCILQGGNVNPCGFNGSLQMIRAGAYPEIWSEFTIEKARSDPFYRFPDDQGYLWARLPKAAGWKTGVSSGCYVFMKPGWPRPSEALPAGARYVTFAGWRDPSKFMHLPWVRENWR